MRAGSLVLLAGPQGLGKSTFALQVARNNAATGRPVLYFSYEHDAEDLTQKLIAMEAGELDDSDQVRITSIRSIFDDLWVSSLEHRLESVPAGVEALTRVAQYSEMLFVHRSTGSRTDLAAIQAAIEAVRELAGSTPLVVVDYLQKVKSSHPRRGGQHHRDRRGPQGPRHRHRRPGPRDRRGREGRPALRQADARQRPARVERAGLRGRHRAGAQQQVRHRRAPPPDLRPRQRRAVPGVRRPDASRRTASVATGRCCSTAPASTRAATSPRARRSRSS